MGLRRIEPRLSSAVARLHAGRSGNPRYLLSDNFSGVDGTALTAHTMNVGPGWTADTGAALISGGSAHFTTDLAGALGPMATTAGAADGTASVSVNLSATNAVAGILFRFADPNNCWLLRLGPAGDVVPGLSIYSIVAGAASQVAYTPSTIPAGPHTLSISMQGPNLTGRADGGRAASYASATFNQTMARLGLYSEKAANTFSNFQEVA